MVKDWLRAVMRPGLQMEQSQGLRKMARMMVRKMANTTRKIAEKRTTTTKKARMLEQLLRMTKSNSSSKESEPRYRRPNKE